MSWICPKCETENPSRVKVCEVCDSPREFSPVDKLKETLKEKYSDFVYQYFIQYHSDVLEAADKGNAEAEFQVGEWFYDRKTLTNHVQYDLIAAFWFLKAANKGHTEAQIKLASCYEEGRGIPQNSAEAMEWYKKAARKGNEIGLQKYLNLRYNTKIYESVLKYKLKLLAGADKGDRYSQYLLGEWFCSHNDKATYRKEAIFWYKKAVQRGSCDAMFKLGECYYNDKNIHKSIEWYVKAANLGHKEACIKLARIYLYGNKIRCDVQEAIKWFNKAGKNIDAYDRYIIGRAYYDGNGVSKDISKAIEYYKSAAEENHSPAQYYLGLCYENGNGVIRDLNVAKSWYEKAASNGHTQAKTKIEELEWEKKKEGRETLCYILAGIVWIIVNIILFVQFDDAHDSWIHEKLINDISVYSAFPVGSALLIFYITKLVVGND